MEFAEVMKQKGRLCDITERCDECCISTDNNGKDKSCSDFMSTYPEEAEKLIMEWAEEHPIKTNRQVLEEVLKEKFGDLFDVRLFGCAQFKNRHCVKECGNCEFYNFWNRQYKEAE